MSGKLVGSVIAALIVGLILGYGVASIAGVTTVYRTTTQTRTVPVTVTTTQTLTSTVTKTVEKEAEYSVKLAYSHKLGFYLVDSKGMTLYFFSKDYDGKSKCYGDCAKKWPPFYVEDLKVSPPLDPKDFGVVTREDGTKQITYKGWPLYYFFKDAKPGDVNGEGVKGVWFVAKPDYTVMIAVKEDLGPYLVDSRGMTLYVFKKDEPNKSNCYGDCAKKWPVFSPNRLIVPSTLNLTDFTFVLRDDGKVQPAYKGQPLYYWFKDTKRGDTTGHGVKDVWFVSSPRGG